MLQYFVLSPEFTEGLCLFTKDGIKGLDGVTILEFLCEWMLVQCYAGRSAFRSPARQSQRAPANEVILTGYSCQG